MNSSQPLPRRCSSISRKLSGLVIGTVGLGSNSDLALLQLVLASKVFSCHLSPQPHMGELLFIPIFCICRVSQANIGDLICCFFNLIRKFSSSFLATQALGISFGFGPTSFFMPPSGVCSLPRHWRKKHSLIKGH